MPYLTIVTDEEILQRTRIEAARRGISVSRLVGEVLRERFSDDDQYERSMMEFFSRGPYLEAADREDARRWPTRDEVHDRRRRG